MGLTADNNSRVICLVLTARTIQAGLVEFVDGQPQVIELTEIAQFEGENGQFKISVDNCLLALGEGAQDISRVVFCLDESWADERDVLVVKKGQMEEMLDALGIEAEGFVGFNPGMAKALIRLQDSTEFIHLTLSVHTLEAEYFAGGKSQGKAACDRSELIVQDLEHVIQKAGPLLANQAKGQYTVSLVNLDDSVVAFDALRQACLSYQWPGLSGAPIIKEFEQKTLIKQTMLYASEIWWEKSSTNFPSSADAHDLLARKDSKHNMSKFFKPSSRLLIPIVVGLLLGLTTLSILFYWYLGQIARVVINVNQKTIRVESKIDAELVMGTSQAQYQLKAQPVTQNVELTGSKKTTGTAMVGEKAIGKAQIINKTNQPKTLQAGTQMRAGNNLIFILNEETVLPATKVSTDASGTKETREYGILEVSLTAKEIGETSNIKADTELTVGVFDRTSYVGKALGAFEGGSSRQVSVVGKSDIDNISKELQAQAKTKAEEIWKNQTATGVFTTPALSVSATSVVSQPVLGEEAEEVKVDAKFEVKALSYQADAIAQLVKQVLSQQVPTGYQLVASEPQVLTQYNLEGKISKLNLELTSFAAPQINTQEWINQLTNKTPVEALAILASKPEIVKTQLEFEPASAEWFGRRLPKNQEKIIINIKNE